MERARSANRAPPATPLPPAAGMPSGFRARLGPGLRGLSSPLVHHRRPRPSDRTRPVRIACLDRPRAPFAPGTAPRRRPRPCPRRKPSRRSISTSLRLQGAGASDLESSSDRARPLGAVRVAEWARAATEPLHSPHANAAARRACEPGSGLPGRAFGDILRRAHRVERPRRGNRTRTRWAIPREGDAAPSPACRSGVAGSMRRPRSEAPIVGTCEPVARAGF
jgi:hypothetical protein